MLGNEPFRNRGRVLGLALGLILPISAASCGGAGIVGEEGIGGPVFEPVQEITEPEQVTVGDTFAVFTWVTDAPSDTHVFIGTAEPTEHVNLTRGPTRYHHATVAGLEPGTTYRYRLESGGRSAPRTDRAPGAFTTLVPPPGEPLFSFATLNDSHFGEEKAGLICFLGACFNPGFVSPWPDHPYWDFMNRSAVDAINALGPDFVIHKGDVSSEFREEEFLEARAVLDGLRMPYHVLRGNHDRTGPPGERGQDFFRSVFGLEKTHRSFLFQDHLFVLLDSVHLETGRAEISEEQFRWLAEEVLPAHPGRRVMVFLHHAVAEQASMYALSPGDRKRLLDLLAAHGGLVGVFSGHSHRAFVAHEPAAGDVPFVETPSAKEYPGGFSLYRVYTGGYLQTFHRVDCERCLAWIEITRGEYWGLAPGILFGRPEHRDFVYRYPGGP